MENDATAKKDKTTVSRRIVLKLVQARDDLSSNIIPPDLLLGCPEDYIRNLGISVKYFRLDARYNPSYTLSMKTAISIPDDLFSAADNLAQKMGLSRSQLYQQAILQFLTHHGQDAVTNALNKVYDNQENRGKLDPVIGYMQGASLVHDEGHNEDDGNW